MNDFQPNHWLDFLYTVIFTLFPPLAILLLINGLLHLNEYLTVFNLSGLLVISLIIFIFIIIYYRHQYKLIYTYAIEVGYPHFRPSIKDLILGFYGSIFSVLVLLFILFMFQPSLKTKEHFIFAIIISTMYQIINILFMTNSKSKLLATSMESLDPALLALIKDIPDSEKISEFRYADIKPASLFLSAGVTKYNGRKNVCLISRYFQWNLTTNELLAVLSHEIGHIHNKDIPIGFFLLAFNYFVRTIYYSAILLALSFIHLPLEVGIVLIILIFSMLSSLIIRHLLNYRMFTQEIRADFYGASIVGNYVMAQTLKKMPNAIPAPIDDDPLGFLGFRIAILNNRAKQAGEPIPSQNRSISRFSNN